MTNVGSLDASRDAAQPERRGWSELYRKEDWWAVWLGVALMVFAIVLFQAGSSNVIKALAINPGGLKWTSFGQLAGHFAQNALLYLYQFLFWLVLFGVTAWKSRLLRLCASGKRSPQVDVKINSGRVLTAASCAVSS